MGWQVRRGGAGTLGCAVCAHERRPCSAPACGHACVPCTAKLKDRPSPRPPCCAAVDVAEPDWILHAAVEPPGSAGPQALLPNDDLWGKLWHLPMIRAPQAWETTTGSSAAAICVVDSVRPPAPGMCTALVFWCGG